MIQLKNKCYVIPTESLCNANCFFCISKSVERQKKQFMDSSDGLFQNTLDYMVKDDVTCFEITGGGEPFLNDNLQQVIFQIRKSAPNAYIKLYTNGSIHREIFEIDELDISTVHWDDAFTDSIYKIQPARELLSDLSFFFKPSRYKIRLSVPIFKGGIDTPEKARHLISVTKKFVDAYVFRPLLENTPNRDLLYVDFDLDEDGVEVDRDCSCFSRVKLWWSDNVVYADWSLSEALFPRVL